MSVERKVEILERILKAITYADEITYRIGETEYLLDRVLFHGANPDHLHLRGYSEGLEIDRDAETYEEDIPAEFGGGKTMRGRLVGEVWVQEDMWKTIQELRKQLLQFTVSTKQSDIKEVEQEDE